MTGRFLSTHAAALSVAVGALALAGCHSSEEQRAAPLPATGPPRTMRVALDPAFGEQTIARALAGPFRLVSSSAERVLVSRPGLTVVFRRMEPYAALAAFRRGELDEAPVPQGEIRAIEAHDTLGAALHAKPLRGLDVVVLPRTFSSKLRRGYKLTVPRAEYQALINERVAPPAYGLRPGTDAIRPADVRKARASLRGLRQIPLRLTVVREPELVEAAELVWAEWRQLGLPVRLVPVRRGAKTRFKRVVASSSDEIYRALGLRPGAPADHVVPLAWVAEARLVSPRVRGWRMDDVGVVDYTRVTLEPRP
jgi:hypothetical protein